MSRETRRPVFNGTVPYFHLILSILTFFVFVLLRENIGEKEYLKIAKISNLSEAQSPLAECSILCFLVALDLLPKMPSFKICVNFCKLWNGGAHYRIVNSNSFLRVRFVNVHFNVVKFSLHWFGQFSLGIVCGETAAI